MGSMLGFGKGRAFALGSLVLSHHCGRVVVIPVHRLLILVKKEIRSHYDTQTRVESDYTVNLKYKFSVYRLGTE